MKITNRQAFYNYQILDRLEAGIALTGAEVKAVRGGHADLTGSFVRIIGSEIYLINAKIFLLPYARPEGYDERRTRKLLLHKKQIIALKTKVATTSLVLVPVSLYLKDGFVKAEIGLAKGKKQYEKRESIRKKDLDREVERELKGKN